MKKMIGLFALTLATSVTSLACSQYEAQFIGKVVKIEKTSADACDVQIDFSTFNSSIMCPLDISQVVGQEISTTDCHKKVNDTISGVLVHDGETLIIE